MAFNPMKRKFLVAHLGEERVRELEETLAVKERALIEGGVAFKALFGGLGDGERPDHPGRGYADDLRAGRVVR